MKLFALAGFAFAVFPKRWSGRSRRARGLPPEALRRADAPSLESVGLQACCADCSQRAYRFIGWWQGARHVIVREGALLAEAQCDTCGQAIAAGGYVLVIVHCDDTRIAARCLTLLLPRGLRRGEP